MWKNGERGAADSKQMELDMKKIFGQKFWCESEACGEDECQRKNATVVKEHRDEVNQKGMMGQGCSET